MKMCEISAPAKIDAKDICRSNSLLAFSDFMSFIIIFEIHFFICMFSINMIRFYN